jgi:hypothetical protein
VIAPVEAGARAPAEPRRLVIPAISLDTAVVTVGLNNKNLQEVPDKIVGWYRYGSKPGQVGTAVFVGHVTGVFAHLADTHPGNLITQDSLLCGRLSGQQSLRPNGESDP